MLQQPIPTAIGIYIISFCFYNVWREIIVETKIPLTSQKEEVLNLSVCFLGSVLACKLGGDYLAYLNRNQMVNICIH